MTDPLFPLRRQHVIHVDVGGELPLVAQQIVDHAPLVGHVGDGNFHLNFVLDRDDPAEFNEVKALNHRLVQRAIAMGGTCTGEHGIGMGKIDVLEEEHGAAVEVMKAIKQALDPENRMNPGKILRL